MDSEQGRTPSSPRLGTAADASKTNCATVPEPCYRGHETSHPKESTQMSKAQRAEHPSVGYSQTTGAKGGRHYVVGSTVTAGLKSFLGRKVALCMDAPMAARVAWRLLAIVAEHEPNAARCEHKKMRGRGTDRKCVVCGAPDIEGLRTVYSPAVPIARGDDVRLSLSYLERMNDVRLREAAERVLEVGLARNLAFALAELETALAAARKPESFHADVPTKLLEPTGWEGAAESTAAAIKAAERTDKPTGGAHPEGEDERWAESILHGRAGGHVQESRSAMRRRRNSARIQMLHTKATREVEQLAEREHYTLVCLFNGRPSRYSSYGINVMARARKLRERGATNILVRRAGAAKPEWLRLVPIKTAPKRRQRNG